MLEWVYELGGIVTFIFYILYKWMWNVNNLVGLRRVVISYTLFLMVISLYIIGHSIVYP